MRALVPISLVALGACLPDPGLPEYPDHPIYVDTDDPALEGPDPWVGQPRLSIGTFYEGGSTEVVEIDNTSTHFYIYDNTFTVAPSDDRVEGLVSDALSATSVGYVGGGVHWDSPRDLSAWTALHVSLWSEDATMEGLQLGMNGGGTEGRVSVSAHGFEADGEWHSLVIPLTAFPGVNRSSVSVALLWVAAGTSAGDTVLIDDVFLSQE